MDSADKRARDKIYREKNKEKIKETQRRYRKNNSERLRKYHSAWREDHEINVIISSLKYWQKKLDAYNERMARVDEGEE